MLTSQDEALTTAVLRLNPRGTKPFYNTSVGCEESCNMSAAPLFSRKTRGMDGAGWDLQPCPDRQC